MYWIFCANEESFDNDFVNFFGWKPLLAQILKQILHSFDMQGFPYCATNGWNFCVPDQVLFNWIAGNKSENDSEGNIRISRQMQNDQKVVAQQC